MNQLLAKLIYSVCMIFIFITLWKAMGGFWSAFLPWNVQTNVLSIMVITPILRVCLLKSSEELNNWVREKNCVRCMVIPG